MSFIKLTIFVLFSGILLDCTIAVMPEQKAFLTKVFNPLEPLLSASEAEIPGVLITLNGKEPGFAFGDGAFSESMAKNLVKKLRQIVQVLSRNTALSPMTFQTFMLMFDTKNARVVMAELKDNLNDVTNTFKQPARGTFLSLFQTFVFGVMNYNFPKARNITKHDITFYVAPKFGVLPKVLLQNFEEISDKSGGGITLTSFTDWGSKCDLPVSAITMIYEANLPSDKGKPVSSTSLSTLFTRCKRFSHASTSGPSAKPNPASSIPSSSAKPNPASSTPGSSAKPNPASSIPGSSAKPNPASSTPGSSAKPNPALTTSTSTSTVTTNKLKPTTHTSTPVPSEKDGTGPKPQPNLNLTQGTCFSIFVPEPTLRSASASTKSTAKQAGGNGSTLQTFNLNIA